MRHFEFVRRRRIWFSISAVIVVGSLASLLLRDLNLSIEFIGGSSFTLTDVDEGVTSEELAAAAEEAGADEVRVQLATDGDTVGAIVHTLAIDPSSPLHRNVVLALEEASGSEDVEASFVGPSWGQRVSRKALQALLVFLLAVVVYISVRLEFKMAVAAILALAHDLILTAGVYSLFGFQVSPATVIAFLTILGYSLYDTVIVFDRVDETAGRLGGAGRRTYGEAVNTSMNEVLTRSINTTLTAIVPVGCLLLIGAQALGATTLTDLSLALFVGMLTGAYSSLFLAGPFLAWWKEREPKLAALAARAQRDQVPAAAATSTSGAATAAPARSTERVRPELAPREYVRGPGRTSRSRRQSGRPKR